MKYLAAKLSSGKTCAWYDYKFTFAKLAKLKEQMEVRWDEEEIILGWLKIIEKVYRIGKV